jgi:hypothetical protein
VSPDEEDEAAGAVANESAASSSPPSSESDRTGDQRQRKLTKKKPAQARVDLFSPYQLGQWLRMPMVDRYLLETLAKWADYRTLEWSGTISGLHKDLGTTRRAISASIDRLDDRTLIEVVDAFDRNSEGTVRLDRRIYELLIVVRVDQRELLTDDDWKTIRARYAPDSRRTRARHAPISANAPAVTSDDALPLRDQGTQGRKEHISPRDHSAAPPKPARRCIVNGCVGDPKLYNRNGERVCEDHDEAF